jgi:hypothetical protein
MFGSLIRRPGFWLTVFLVGVAVLVLTACGNPQQASPIVCATWQAPDGTWMEEDNEEVDSDPCDLDDLFEVRTTAPAKPKLAASPAKPNVSNTRR